MGNQDGGICNGTCSGKCRGSCDTSASANATCEGECSGTCTGTATAPRCKAELTPPSCEASADCQASCKASASARAECTPPAVEISGTALPGGPQSFADVGISKKSFCGLLGNLTAAVDVETTAGFCLIPAGAAIADSADNLAVSVSASADVITAL